MAPYYAQVVGLGLIWVTFHCIGMCGPIMASLTAGMGVHRAEGRLVRIWRATKGVLAYQGGRALVYAILGATAGLVGAAAQAWIEGIAQTAGLIVAVVLVGIGIWKLLPLSVPVSEAATQRASTGFAGAVMGRISRHLPTSGALRMAGFGLVLGFLPCMLMFWILGIAASTASPFHGAMIMLLLVAMTTPVLIIAALGASLPGFFSRLRSEFVLGGALVLSGMWLGLIAMAANGWIEHMEFTVEIADRTLPIVLW